jgi:hypothetical protein
MVAKKGRGLLMAYSEVLPEHEEEFNRWYDEEHLPERWDFPGVLDAARYLAVKGGPKYLACYELADPDAWNSGVWNHARENPTEWSKRMSPLVIGVNFILNVYKLIYPDYVSPETEQSGMAPVMMIGRHSVPPDLETQFNQVYNTERLPAAYDVPGYIRGRRFQAEVGEPKYTTVHEMETLEVANSPEWGAWSTGGSSLWSSVMRPNMANPEGSPGIYTRIFPK